MELLEIFLEILKYVLPSIIVFFTAFYLFKAYLDREYKRGQLEQRSATQQITLPLRLQAYERMILFLERLSPNNLFIRVKKPGITAKQFQAILLADIRSEFEHNLSQQIYISVEGWNEIKIAKEEMIKIIITAAESLNANASALDLSKLVFEIIIRNNEIPTQKAIDILKREVQKNF